MLHIASRIACGTELNAFLTLRARTPILNFLQPFRNTNCWSLNVLFESRSPSNGLRKAFNYLFDSPWEVQAWDWGLQLNFKITSFHGDYYGFFSTKLHSSFHEVSFDLLMALTNERCASLVPSSTSCYARVSLRWCRFRRWFAEFQQVIIHLRK